MSLRVLILALLTIPVFVPIVYYLLTGDSSGPVTGPVLSPIPRAILPSVLFGAPILLLVLMFRQFDRSLRHLVQETDRLAQGNLQTPIQVKGAVELNTLAKALEEMRKSLNQDRERKAFLLMGLSHDFRTPLGLIKGYTEAIEDELEGSNPECTKYLGIIANKVEQLERMVSRWIELVRLETGDRVATFESVPLALWLGPLWKRFEADSELLGRKFRGELVLDPHLSLALDTELMERVLENLLGNGLKYSPPGGTLRWIVHQEDHSVVFDLEDDGPGIPEAEHHLIWEPFYRGKNPAKAGWGLGLSVVKSIVSAHGFSIELSPTESGKGTRFRLTAPLNSADHSIF